MIVVPLAKGRNGSGTESCAGKDGSVSWVGFAAGGALVAAGLMLLTGQRRAGAIAAASGTALALLDQKETVAAWWSAFPAYLEQAQQVLVKVENAVDGIEAKRQSLDRLLAR